jgi:hypothetical protein
MNQQSTTTEVSQSCDQFTITMAAQPHYRPPRITVFGSVIDLTRGSGGDYDDECTSGKWPGDEE